jgi:predicted O-linked N-acetylglucosamine transferase (SPINDLY family)
MNDIKDDAMYSITEIMRTGLTTLPLRTVQRYARNNRVKSIDNSYKFYGYQINEMNNLYAKKRAKKKESGVTYANVPPIKKEVAQDLITLIKDIDNEDYVRAMLVAIKEDKHLEEFSQEEYKIMEQQLTDSVNLSKRIEEYKEEIQRMDDYVQDYRNNIEYLKKSLDSRAKETDIILKSVIQRNMIEAKREGLDTN